MCYVLVNEVNDEIHNLFELIYYTFCQNYTSEPKLTF